MAEEELVTVDLGRSRDQRAYRRVHGEARIVAGIEVEIEEVAREVLEHEAEAGPALVEPWHERFARKPAERVDEQLSGAVEVSAIRTKLVEICVSQRGADRAGAQTRAAWRAQRRGQERVA